MAWITKPSATEKIARRAEPYVTDAHRARWERDLIPKYATRHGALMPILHEIQHEHRHIPHQAMIEIADFLKITPADVLDTVSFYEEYTTEPVGRCVIGICQSLACEACGHRALVDHVREKLDLEPHETTEDGLFTLLTLECLGSCDTAPVALLNDVLYESLTVERLDQLIERVRVGGSAAIPHGRKVGPGVAGTEDIEK
ncbi:MAG: NAD(P)H-dependent oxidoreductase subunit E [Phycisphaeraceae bacterium]|nr:NAD(P)H-dependent oxidoreductase subunit E [Phycisphaeraceae bacterium]